VFVATRPDLEKNRNQSHLFRVSIDGGEVVQLTRRGSSNTEPALSPDGRWIAFTSNRADKTPQIWMLPAAGGEARQITKLRLGARRPVWFPDGNRLVAISPVYPDTIHQSQIEKREDELKEKGPGPRVIESLMFRHWDSWSEDKIDHLFVVEVESGDVRDLTPGPYPVPPRSLGGTPDYAVSPDGNEVCFVSLREPDKAHFTESNFQALSTNLNLWVVPSGGGEPRRISPWGGVNAFPAYSPDGSRIAFTGMRRAGYEADKRELLICEPKSGAIEEVAAGFDQSVGPPVWSPDGKKLYFAAQDRGRSRIYSVSAGGGEPEAVTEKAVDTTPFVSPDGKTLIFARQTATAPPEIYRVGTGGKGQRTLTSMNEKLLGELELQDPVDFWFEGANDERVHGFILKPPGFEAGKKYPVVFLIHGGPQSAFTLDFHERWNAQLFASPGFVVVQINPRGSTGFGQEFTDAIRGEWGGATYEDLSRGFDYVLGKYEYCDPERTAAAGASFGGFMVNWIAGRTDRFKCLVSHDGIFNTEMMDFATDELWFTEWEFGGAPWESPESYLKWSPHLHVDKMKTPLLVIQGEQDFRCVATEGLTLFTALQRKGVPSKLLYFPDEGHWVLKPKNRKVWNETVLGWLEKYLK
jgi:dipeptidyl aminopeptidase/acylaminoacyl peptidase